MRLLGSRISGSARIRQLGATARRSTSSRFGYEKAEHHRVDESSIHPSGLAQHALGTKPDPHGDSAHCRVVSECVELEPMQSAGVEPVSAQNAYYFSAESSTAERRPQ